MSNKQALYALEESAGNTGTETKDSNRETMKIISNTHDKTTHINNGSACQVRGCSCSEFRGNPIDQFMYCVNCGHLAGYHVAY